MKKLLLALAFLLPLLAACAGFDPGPLLSPPANTAVPTQAPAATAAAAATLPAAIETPTAGQLPPAPGETPVLMCTPPACAPGEGYACPSGDCPGGCGTVCAVPTAVTGPLAPAPTDWETLEGWLSGLWRSNVNPAAVRAALQQSGRQHNDADWRAADLDGDLLDEWILVLYDPSLPATPVGAAGDLWIVNGNGVVFRYYPAPSSDIFDFMAPTIVGLTDMTGDGRPEIISDARVCGAHTCTGVYRVIGQTAAGLGDLVQRPAATAEDKTTTILMATPDVRLEDTNGDGLTDLIVHGGLIGSVGAGVVRQRSEIWRWDGAAVSLAETILDPTNERHLLLYEANDLLAAGELDRALALYEGIINAAPAQVYDDISRFAAFRLIFIDLLQGQGERAAGRLEWLRTNFPDAAATNAAAELLAGWTGAEGQATLCAAIESELATQDNPTGVLSDMGYGNPSLTAADFCP